MVLIHVSQFFTLLALHERWSSSLPLNVDSLSPLPRGTGHSGRLCMGSEARGQKVTLLPRLSPGTLILGARTPCCEEAQGAGRGHMFQFPGEVPTVSTTTSQGGRAWH